MGDPIIRVENLGKKYLLDHQQQERYTALRDVMSDRAKALFRPTQNFFRRTQNSKLGSAGSPDAKAQSSKEEFWALKDVSFEINQGDRVGIIGRNGAGKSTLLKILSRITEPTTGRIRIKGRVASLLEVGTGFHPELTGRENIFLNGAILGMSRAEINRKFDEIVAFAEVERFLDTPVKRYSSGMYVRLAFAVAAHLEPEVLIVDEVLAVGDAQFQQKCLGKMENIGEEGRTVILVSHNMSTVRQLCTKAFLLKGGCLNLDGLPSEVISNYIQNELKEDRRKNRAYKHIKGDGSAQIQKIVINKASDLECIVSIFEEIEISIDYVVNTPLNYLECFLLISSLEGDVQASLFQRDSGTYIEPSIGQGSTKIRFKNYLMPGKYLLSAGFFDRAKQFVDWVEYAESFLVESSFDDGRKYDNRLGKVGFLADWMAV